MRLLVYTSSTLKRVGKGGGGVVVHGSRELNQTFPESCKIQRLILFVIHIVLQNWSVNYFELCIHKK